MHARLAAACALTALIVSAATPARAYEDQLTLGAIAGYAAVVTSSTSLPVHGAMLGIDASIGLDDTWSVRAQIAYAIHPAAAPLHVGLFGAEIVYLMDVVEIVPFAGLGLDMLATIYENDLGADFAAHLVVGLDYLLSRELLIGLDVRPYILVTRLSTEPVYLTALARISLVFDL